MAKKLHNFEVMEILDGMVEGGFFEEHYERGLSADRTMEEAYLIGAALSQLGGEILAAAKEHVLDTYRGVRGKQLDGRLVIEWRQGGSQLRVDSAVVRKLHPREEYPHYWKEVHTREGVSIAIGERVEPLEAPESVKVREIPF